MKKIAIMILAIAAANSGMSQEAGFIAIDGKAFGNAGIGISL